MCVGPAPATCINYTLSINSQWDRGEFPFLSHSRGLLSPTISWKAGSPSVTTSTISGAKLSSPAHLRASRAFSDQAGCWSISVPSSQEKGRRMEHRKLHSSLGSGTPKGGAGRITIVTCAQHLVCMELFKATDRGYLPKWSSRQPHEEILLISPFCRWGTEKLKTFPKITQLLNWHRLDWSPVSARLQHLCSYVARNSGCTWRAVKRYWYLGLHPRNMDLIDL